MSGKQDWSRVSLEAKQKKEDYRKSQRDIKREEKIGELGGQTIEVQLRFPLSDELRQERKDYLYDLMYPKRHLSKHQKRQAYPSTRKRYRETEKINGAERTLEAVIKANIRSAKSRAKKFGLPFSLSYEDLEVPERCPVLGITFSTCTETRENSPSLDRLIPELGYVKGNVKVISFKANRLKNNATLEELKAIVKYLESNGE